MHWPINRVLRKMTQNTMIRPCILFCPICHRDIPVLVSHALLADALPLAVDPLFAVVLGAVLVVLLAQCFFQVSVAPPAWQSHSLHAR